MFDILAYLGITAAYQWVFKPILEDLAKEAAKDFAKDYCKDALKSVLLGKDEWKKAVARALKAFLEEFEGELVAAGVPDLGVEAYQKSLANFTKRADVRQILGGALTDPDTPVDAPRMDQIW